MRRSDIEASVRLKYGDPDEVAAFSTVAAEGLAPFEEALVLQAFMSMGYGLSRWTWCL